MLPFIGEEQPWAAIKLPDDDIPLTGEISSTVGYSTINSTEGDEAELTTNTNSGNTELSERSETGSTIPCVIKRQNLADRNQTSPSPGKKETTPLCPSELK